MGRHTDAYATINSTREISREIGYLLGNVDMGTQEFAGMGYHVNEVQMM